MELLQVKNLSFSYPNSQDQALDGVSLNVEQGQFVLVCGASGCGKTTLLRLLKPEVAPFGELKGDIWYDETSLTDLDPRVSATDIGFVSQNPDAQIVTDKVWHELAFGLESLGTDTPTIRRRVGEMASYFGIQNWYHQSTDSLSGGQKQLLNLASVMTMQPKLLLLDEPTAQLDPITASEFLATLHKLNRDLGLTILLVEHRLEEIFPYVDVVMMMSAGHLEFNDEPDKVATSMKGHPLAAGLPSAARIWAGLDLEPPCPLTVRSGRDMLRVSFSHLQGERIPESPTQSSDESDEVIAAADLWFRYDKNLPDVLKGMDIKVRRGEIFGILGGNGTGKTTLLNVLAGLERPYKGKVLIDGKKISAYKRNAIYRNKLALLTQNPAAMFLKKSVREDYYDLLKTMEVGKEEQDSQIEDVAKTIGIESLLDSHPFDLSGGEQQKCALGKLLLTQPEIVLLDEPTKGIDAFAKIMMAELLQALRSDGKTIVLVTHDVEFAAQVSDRCALVFDGSIISQGRPNDFFSDNSFYTTAASRIARDIFPNAILCEEVIALSKGETSTVQAQEKTVQV
ncbi:MAG: ABC transporter ATP-binding protein [Fastidiosipilaceae bacterium]|jgi:energy-coupling factor transporter ATP-binding protein EcfA2|nr:ATP-binding cassette domain-containing protein [Clostridiaceae bacterium]